MKLSEMKPEDILRPDAVEKYKQMCETVWWELIRLDSSLFVLQRINEFPFAVLADHNRTLFWRLAFVNFLDTAVLCITRLETDKRLAEFRNFVDDAIAEPSIRYQLRHELRALGCWRKRVATILRRIEAMRNKVVAHLDRLILQGEARAMPQISMADLRMACEMMKAVFAKLCIGGARATLPLAYLSGSPDIEELLDHVASA